MDLKELNHAGEHAVFGSIEVLGDIESSNLKTVRREVNLIQNTQVKLNTKVDEYWEDLSDDGIITPTEKIALRKEWEGIQQTYNALYQEALAKQILNTPYWIDYDTAYDTLKDVLFTDEAIFDFMENTSTLKDKDALDEAFSEYYYSQQFVNLAITTGLIDKLGLRSLTSLEEEGYNGELAFYRGELYQYLDDTWVKVNTQPYLGIINNNTSALTQAEEGQYFLTGTTPFYIMDELYVNEMALVVNNDTLLVTYEKTELGKIYYKHNDVWVQADDDDPRYIAILADYITVTGQMPEMFVEQVKEIAETTIPPQPKYLGVSSTSPANPNKGDYFVYSGISTGDWVKSRIYRWSGSLWERLDYDDYNNSDYYMSALQDILNLENAGDGYFSSLFCNAFFANQASINALKVKTIYLYNTGAIQSQNATYVAETTGLRIDASGNIDANGSVHIKGPCAIGTSLSNRGNYDVMIAGHTKVVGEIVSKSFFSENYNAATKTGVAINPYNPSILINDALRAGTLEANRIIPWDYRGRIFIAYIDVAGALGHTYGDTITDKSAIRDFIINSGSIYFFAFGGVVVNVSGSQASYQINHIGYHELDDCFRFCTNNGDNLSISYNNVVSIRICL